MSNEVNEQSGLVTLEADLIGISPISFSKAMSSVKGQGQADDVFEEEHWRERMHVNSDGQVYVPPGMVKITVEKAAQFLSEKTKGNQTYTKHFTAGTMVTEPMILLDNKSKPVMAAEVESERLFVPSDGKRGGSKRVWKRFPIIDAGWRIHCKIYILDQLLQDKIDKVEEYLRFGGKMIGLGRYRPINGGYYGRYIVENCKHLKS